MEGDDFRNHLLFYFNYSQIPSLFVTQPTNGFWAFLQLCIINKQRTQMKNIMHSIATILNRS
jgi:hypothetical protein